MRVCICVHVSGDSVFTVLRTARSGERKSYKGQQKHSGPLTRLSRFHCSWSDALLCWLIQSVPGEAGI